MRDSTGSYSLEVIYQPDEVAEAGWLFERERALVLPVVLTIVLSLLVAFYLSYAIPWDDGAENKLVRFVCCWIAGALAFSPYVASRKARVSNRYRLSQLASLKVKYIVSSDGLQVFLVNGNTELIAWKRFSACLNLPSSITLVLGDEIYPLPKRCFDSADSVRKVLRVIIDGGVSFSNRGKPLERVDYAGVDPELAHTLPSLIFMAEAAERAAKLEELNIDEAEADDLEIIEPVQEVGFFRLSAPHPHSNLFTEPLAGRSYKSYVEVHCVYKYQELLKIDRRLYWRYGFRTVVSVHLYIVLLLWGLTAMLYLFASLNFSGFSVIVSGLYFAIAIATVGQHLDQRADNVMELLQKRQPVIIELSEYLCVIRDRSAVLNLSWSAFFMCATTQDFYICPWSNGSVIIPRKAVKEEQADDLKMLLKQNILKHEDW